MLFINPMWDNEAQRIGKRRCTRLGYALHALSDLIGSVALVLLLSTVASLGYQSIIGTFRAGLLWLSRFHLEPRLSAQFCISSRG